MIKLGAIPQEPAAQLKTLGGRIRIARKRRGQTLRELAGRARIAPNTLLAIERGKPTVSVGVLATVLWLLGLSDGIASLADPDADAHGKALELARAPKRMRTRRAQEVLDDF